MPDEAVEISDVIICNGALGHIGAALINSLDDTTANAIWCRTHYQTTRRSLLRRNRWHFAETRVNLSAEETAPAFEYAYAYGLPSNLIRISQYNGTAVTFNTANIDGWMHFENFYKIEGRSLLTNDGQASIVYVKDVVDPTFFDPLFLEVFTYFLASKLASAIMKNHGMSRELFARAFDYILPPALAVSGQEGSTQPYISDNLTWGR